MPAGATGLERRGGPRIAVEILLRLAAIGAILGAVALAVVLPYSPGDRLLSIGGQTLPTLCLSRSVLGISCPGCGLTRSWVALAHGDIDGSLRDHPLGALVMAYLLLQAARQGMVLLVGDPSARFRAFGRLLDRSGIAVAGLLGLVWLVRFVGGG